MKTKLLVVLLTSASICSLQANEFENPARPANEDSLKPWVEIDITGITIDAPIAGNLTVMNVRVYNQHGQQIFTRHSRGESVVIDPTSLDDGLYQYDAVAVFTADEFDENEQPKEFLRRQFGEFQIKDGEMVPAPDSDNLTPATGETMPEPEASKTLSQRLQHGFGTALSWVIPSAQADVFSIVDIESTVPRLRMDDLDSTGLNWTINGSDNSFSLKNEELGQNVFSFANDADATNAISMTSTGVMRLQNNNVIITRSGNMALGASAAGATLDIHDTDPTIELFDETDSTSTDLAYDNGTFAINSFFRAKADAPTNALYINSDGDIGLGTSLPSASLDIHHSSPTIELSDDTDSTTMKMRYDAGFFLLLGSGGQNIIATEDDAPADSLFINSLGRIGVGTDSPSEELEIESTNPRIWFEDSSSLVDFSLGETASTFTLEIEGNGTGNPVGKAFVLQAITGNFGLYDSSPDATLDVQSYDGESAKIQVQNTTSTVAPRTLFELINPGNTKFSLTNTDANVEWAFANPGSGFRVSRQGSGVVEFDLLNNGNLTIAGTLTENSDRNAKTNIVPIDQQVILEKVAALPIQQWQYKDALGENHIGPMAQDFYAAFELGGTDKGIATLDSAGVALASIQALIQQNQQQQAQLEQQATALQQLDQLKRDFAAQQQVIFQLQQRLDQSLPKALLTAQ